MALAVEEQRVALHTISETGLALQLGLDFLAVVGHAVRVGVEREVVIRACDLACIRVGGDLGLPGSLRGIELAFELFHLLVGGGDLHGNLRRFLLLLRRGHGHAGLGVERAGAVLALLRDVVEEGVETVKIARGDGVVFVVVALRAGDAHAEPRRAQRAHAVHEVDVEILGVNDAAFVGGHHIAHEAAGNLLVHRGIGEEVARELLDGEAVEGLVVVEGAHDPVAPEPGLAQGIVVIAGGVRVAGEIEPGDRKPLAVVRGGEQAVHHVLIGAWRLVGEEGVHLSGLGRQAGEREGDAAQENFARGFGLEIELLGFELRSEEGINGIGGW